MRVVHLKPKSRRKNLPRLEWHVVTRHAYDAAEKAKHATKQQHSRKTVNWKCDIKVSEEKFFRWKRSCAYAAVRHAPTHSLDKEYLGWRISHPVETFCADNPYAHLSDRTELISAASPWNWPVILKRSFQTVESYTWISAQFLNVIFTHPPYLVSREAIS